MSATVLHKPAASTTGQAESAWRLEGAWVPALTCLALNVAVFAAILASHPAYLSDYREGENPDARHYVLLGRNFFLTGHYSRCSAPPYYPDYLRTPVYPLFAGGLDLLGGVGALYVVQALLHVGSCLLLYALVRRYFGRGAAFWASLLLATDLTLVISNFEAMAEPLFLFLALAGASCLLPATLGSDDAPARAWCLAGGGALLGLATLARPAGLYLPFVFAVLLAAVGFARRRLALHAGLAGVVLAAALAPVGAWVVRNRAVFSVARLTHNDAIMLVYFTGAGAIQVHEGVTRDQAEERLREEFGLPSTEITNNHWLADRPVAELDAQLRGAVWPLLSRHPKALVVSSLVGMAKGTFSHTIGTLAVMTGREWVAPGTGALLRADRGAIDRLAQNGPLLAGAFAWQLAHNVLTWGLALVGVVLALRAPQARPFALALLLVLAYFHLTVAVVGAEAYYRSRTPHMPYVFAFAGLALSRLRPRPAAPA